ncbi:hypothetical protein niasHT_002424 [Heterodera trifolii]|uniref:Uncharacterized protein n=1 Tax=Heterodera trifolii TaxID=157864 RepID=A0ABD2LM79_9BILA
MSDLQFTRQCDKRHEDLMAVQECMAKTGMDYAACNNSQANDPKFEGLYGGYTCEKCIIGEQNKDNSNENYKLYSPTAKPSTPNTATNANELEIFVPINVDDYRSGTACISPKPLFIIVVFAILAIIGARIHDKMFG